MPAGALADLAAPRRLRSRACSPATSSTSTGRSPSVTRRPRQPRAPARGALPATPSVSPREPLDEIHRAKPRQRRRLRADDALRRARQMRRAGEVEHLGDVAHVVAGILRQLRGRDQSHEIDHALEVRRAVRGEGAAQMLARDARARRRAAACAPVVPPSATMQRHAARCSGVVERERVAADRAARVANRVENACRSTRSRSTVSSTASTSTSAKSSAAHCASAGDSEARSVVSPKNGTLGNSRASARGAPRLLLRAGEVDDRRVDERGAEGLLELLGRLREQQSRAPARKGGARDGARALARGVEHDRGGARCRAAARRAHVARGHDGLRVAGVERQSELQLALRARQHRLASAATVRRSSRARGASTLRAFAYEIADARVVVRRPTGTR